MKDSIHHFLIEDSGPLRGFYFHQFGQKKEEFERLMDLGCFYRNKKRLLAETTLEKGDYLRVHTKPKRFPLPDNILSFIHFENDDFLILDKPSGLPSHASLDNRKENALFLLRESKTSNIFLTHRLDHKTSGLMLFAKTKDFQRDFNHLLSLGKVKKYYEVLSKNCLQPQSYRHYMEKSAYAPKKLYDTKKENCSECIMKVVAFEKKRGIYHHKVELITGRSHQIRSQFSYLGAPIIGDEEYGAEHSSIFGLRCVELSFKYKNIEYDFYKKSETIAIL